MNMMNQTTMIMKKYLKIGKRKKKIKKNFKKGIDKLLKVC